MPLRLTGLIIFVVALGSLPAAPSPRTSAEPTATPDIAGIWVLNPALTERPAEIGFDPGWATSGAGESGDAAGEKSRGSRGRRGGGGGERRAPQVVRESADDSTRATQLTEEARTPPAHLTIVQQTDTVSISDDQGLSRTFHPTGHLEELTLGTVSLPTTSRWANGSLEVVYDVVSGWQLRYRYTPSADRTHLVVDIRFIQQGHEGDEVRLTYESPEAHEHTIAGEASSAVPAPHVSPPATGGGGGSSSSSGATARPPVLPPGSELRGITTIGTVVDTLSAPAEACGLNQARIKSSIASILAAAGFKTQPLADEDTYVWVNIATSRLPDGTCVSRYDASLMTQADASLPYLKGLVALDVPLLHEGGLAGGPPTAHAKSVIDALSTTVNRFVARVHDASR